MEFYKQFLQSKGTPAGSHPGMHLTIFGKHPAWDDHIPNVGSTTETLSILKRDFYVRGIGGLIDAGAWDKMNGDDVLDGFNHLFVAQRGREGIVGRMWASSDGKGRARYPMVVAIHTVNIPLHRCLQELFWQLEKFREDCITRTREREISQIVNSAQEKLNALTEEFASDTPDSVEYGEILKRMLTIEGLDDSIRHSRLLYEVKNKLEPFSPANNEKMLPAETVPGEHIRLPCTSDLEEADVFIAWLTYLRTQISPRIPVFILKPIAGLWMDAIVGHLDGKQLLCLRSSLHHSPPVTELKYNIPAEFNDSVQKQLTGIADWDQVPHENTVFEGTTRRRAMDSKNSTDDDEEGFLSKPKNLIILGVILVVIVVAAILAVFSLSSSEEEATVESVESAVNVPRQSLSGETFNPDPAQALAYLADAEGLWYPRLLRYTRNQTIKDQWRQDPDLSRLLDILESAELRKLIENVGPVANIGVSQLASMDPSTTDELINLAKAIHEIEEVLADWQVSKNRETIVSFLSDSLDNRLLDELNQKVPVLKYDDRLGEQIQNRLKSAPFLADLSALIAQFQEDLDFLNSLSLDSLGKVGEWTDVRLASSSSLEDLSDNLNAIAKGLQSLKQALQESPLPDEQALMADARYAEIMAAPNGQFAALTDLIIDYQPIAEGELPEMSIESAYPRNELEKELATITKLDPEFQKSPYLARWEALGAELADLSQIPAINMNRGQIRAGLSRVSSMLDSLKLDLGKAIADRSDPGGWYAALQSMTFGNEAFNAAWQRRLDESVPGSIIEELTNDNTAFIEKRQEMEAWRSLYEETLDVASTIRYPEAEAGASPLSKARNAWISDLHDMLVYKALAGFLDELGIPINENIQAWEPFLQWKSEFDQQITETYSRLEADLSALETDLAGQGTENYEELNDRIKQVWPSVEPGANINELMDGLDALTSTRALTSPPELLRVVSQSDWSGLRWAAWRKLESLPDWPATVEELEQFNRAGTRMLDHGFSVEVLDEALKSAWSKSIGLNPDRSLRSELWKFFDDKGWQPANLSDAEQYDRLIALNIDKSMLQMDREAVIEKRNSIIEAIRSLEGVIRSVEVAGFARELELLHFEDGKTIDMELLADAGPGSAGWQVAEADPQGKWVIYTWRSENLRFDEGVDEYKLGFILVEPMNQERFYLGSDEISAGIFFDWISESVSWANFPHDLPQSAFGSDSLQNDISWRSGPRSWTLGTDSELYVTRDWQIQSNTQDVPVQQDRDRRPSRYSPVNYISPDTAYAWAQLVNCRLPSPKEFTGLTSSNSSAGEGSNLRDATWASHLAFIKQKLGAMNTSWPDNDCFIPENMTVPRHSDALPAVSMNDGSLWFRNVGTDPLAPVKMENIHGNMAEFVFDTGNDAFFVIGASALSPSEVVWNAPYRLNAAPIRGFSDVGLRIAFDAPTPLPGRILLDALLNAPMLSLSDQ